MSGSQEEGGEAAHLEALQEVAPVDLGCAEGDAGTEDLAFAIGADAQGEGHGAVEDRGGGGEEGGWRVGEPQPP